MPVAAALLLDDDVRPLLLLRFEQQPADVEVADTHERLLLHDDEINRRLAL